MTRPSAILFDLGETLLRVLPYDLQAGVSALRRVRWLEPALSARTDGDVHGHLSSEIARVRATNATDFTVRDWLRRLAPRPSPADLDAAERALRRAAVPARPLPGVEQALEAIARRGIRMAVLSNSVFSATTLQDELSRHRLWPFFEFVISSADHGIRKPDPAIFRAALGRLGLEAPAVWFMGDSWEKDVLGALAVGMEAIWLDDAEAAKSGTPAAGAPAPAAAAWRRIAGWSDLVGCLPIAAPSG